LRDATKRLDPEAVAKPSHDVDVPFAYDKLDSDPLVAVKVVALKFEANKLVDVVFVPVAFVHVRLVKFDGVDPVIVRFAIVAFVAKKLVVVALVVVELLIVAFDVTKLGAVSELMLAVNAFTIVPLAVAKPSQEVDVPLVKVKLEAEPFVTNRFVFVAFVVVKFVAWPFVTNRLVEVVFVPVALVHVRFGKLDVCEPVIDKFVTVREVRVAFVAVRFVVVTFENIALPPFSVVLFSVAIVPEVACRFVRVAFVANRLVDVVFVPVALVQRRFANEPAPDVTDVNNADVEETNVATKLFVVTFANCPFQRNAEDPRDKAASMEGKILPVDVPPAN